MILLLSWQLHLTFLQLRRPAWRLLLALAFALALTTLLQYQLLMLRLLAALTFSVLAVLLSLADLCLTMLLPRQRNSVMLLPQQPRFL